MEVEAEVFATHAVSRMTKRGEDPADWVRPKFLGGGLQKEF